MIEGLLLVNKAIHKTSFSLVSILRKITNVRKIGHAGTLDPFATGLMILLIGKNYTRRSNQFLSQEKEYLAKILLGQTTDTYDTEGRTVKTSAYRPSLGEVQTTLARFQGLTRQVPPMFSAKKIKGQKLYRLARRGIEIEREPVSVHLQIQLLEYNYPFLSLRIVCSSGAYIRSLAYDIGETLSCGAHLCALERTRSGQFHVKDALLQNQLLSPGFDITPFLKRIT